MAGMTPVENTGGAPQGSILGEGSNKTYLPYLLLISGLGGLLAGVDFGIIGGALIYLDKTISMTEAELSFIVAVYTLGCMGAALVAGILADWLGRKLMMIAGGLMFVSSIFLIFTSQGFGPLFSGRILMGLSGGVICVVVPLYMAECLPSSIRGRGTSIFQFMLTLGIVIAGLIGTYFAGLHDKEITAAAGDVAKIFAADDIAWRRMFLVAAVPGIFYTIGAFFIKESPRWLFRRNKADKAEAILRLSRSETQTKLEISEMGQHAAKHGDSGSVKDFVASLLQRKYIVPFAIACVVLACTQATGINSIIAYAVVILKQAGLSDVNATLGLTVITAFNCVVTLIGAALVDRLGRKILLSVGTAGIVISLACGGLIFRQFESQRLDVSDKLVACMAADGQSLSIKVDETTMGKLASNQLGQLSVLYRYEGVPAAMTAQDQGIVATLNRTLFGKKFDGRRQDIARVFANAEKPEDRVMTIKPKIDKKWETKADGSKIEVEKILDKGKLTVLRAKYGPVPSPTTGLLIAAFLCLAVSFFAVGPGVCVWLALTELMPTRIRSMGMGIAMLLNTGVSFLIALFFLPVVGNYGFSAMFFFWSGCTVIYFLTAAFWMPETKGKTLEEIEDYFEGKKSAK